jgi:hypothetical protein
MLGDIEVARKLIDEGVARAVESGHLMELINAYNYKAVIEVVLGDAQGALHTAGIYADICRRHQLEPWPTFTFQSVWARARLGDRKIGIAELRRVLAASLEKNWRSSIPGFQARLAELEAEEGDFKGALARISGALALAREMGALTSDAFLHRLRGEILLKRDPVNPAPAEAAFQTALAIAQQQGGRFYGLRAALSLAKLPPRSSPRRARVGAGRLFADAEDARNRRSAGAPIAIDVRPLRSVRLFRARMPAVALTPVFPETTPVGALPPFADSGTRGWG